LFALSFAVVRYVEWSSAANQAEFMMRSERTTDTVRIAGPHSLQDIILERDAFGVVFLKPFFRGLFVRRAAHHQQRASAASIDLHFIF
jgi:hypothetical protein